ncbi:unnamed protein product [Rotaria sordida]|uniref:Uncharacterized protein n=1 Tax=Rotaria sordida TaxID=392033 RepID=A0A814BYS3_9BILA|nr:unnamed protein product [Rotaria sordida]CAF0980919.1 unnamed protein product [Rotaria sordida]
MSKYESHQTNNLRSNSTKSYSPESNDDEFEEHIDDRNTPTTNDNSISMKTPQSIDDLLDVDDNDNQNEENKEEIENDNDDDGDADDDDDDDDSTRLSIDDQNTSETTRHKKSNEKNGKLQPLVKLMNVCDYVNSMNKDYLYNAQCQHISIVVYSSIERCVCGCVE